MRNFDISKVAQFSWKEYKLQNSKFPEKRFWRNHVWSFTQIYNLGTWTTYTRNWDGAKFSFIECNIKTESNMCKHVELRIRPMSVHISIVIPCPDRKCLDFFNNTWLKEAINCWKSFLTWEARCFCRIRWIPQVFSICVSAKNKLWN